MLGLKEILADSEVVVMRRLVLLLAVLFSMNVFSYGYFTLPGRCYLNQSQASCQICNTTFRPLVCSANATAVSWRGYTYQNWGQGIVYPGQCMWVNVWARNPYWDTLRYANAFASCRF